MIADGRLLQAREVLLSIISLYDGYRELRPLVENAKVSAEILEHGRSKKFEFVSYAGGA